MSRAQSPLDPLCLAMGKESTEYEQSITYSCFNWRPRHRLEKAATAPIKRKKSAVTAIYPFEIFSSL